MTNSARLVILVALAGSGLLLAQTAHGFVSVGSERRELHFARAAEVTDDLDSSKKMIRLILSEAPLPLKALFDSRTLYDIRSERKNQVVEFNFRDHGGSVNWFLTGHDMEGMFSLSRSPNPFPYELNNNGVMSGKVVSKSDPDDWPSRTYEISVTYSARLDEVPAATDHALLPTPSDALAAAAAKHPAAKAYFQLQDAIRSGDKAAILAAMPADRRARIDSPDFPQILKRIQEMLPSNVSVLRAVDKDGQVTLLLEDGGHHKGEAILRLESGRWQLQSESWQN